MNQREDYSRNSAVQAATATGPAPLDREAAGVLRDTYRLLSATLAFAALVAGVAAATGAPFLGLLPTLAGYFGLLFLTSALRNSGWGILSVFALTGFMGYTLGPILNVYLAMQGGGQLIATALGTTAVAFFGLSWYARQENSVDVLRFGNFLFIGILTAFVLGLVAFFMKMPGLYLAVSGMFVLLSSALIMWQTQAIVRGGERNYIMATVTLFVSIYNLFTSLLHLLGALGDE